MGKKDFKRPQAAPPSKPAAPLGASGDGKSSFLGENMSTIIGVLVVVIGYIAYSQVFAPVGIKSLEQNKDVETLKSLLMGEDPGN